MSNLENQYDMSLVVPQDLLPKAKVFSFVDDVSLGDGYEVMYIKDIDSVYGLKKPFVVIVDGRSLTELFSQISCVHRILGMVMLLAVERRGSEDVFVDITESVDELLDVDQDRGRVRSRRGLAGRR